MQEFMLLIRNLQDAKEGFSVETEKEFLHACMTYIEQLTSKGLLISAQPLTREGVMIAGTPGHWQQGPYSTTREVIVGYYHIVATGLEEAVSIAKGNPEFMYTTTARVEVRPVKMKEEATAYNYPGGK